MPHTPIGIRRRNTRRQRVVEGTLLVGLIVLLLLTALGTLATWNAWTEAPVPAPAGDSSNGRVLSRHDRPRG